MEARRPAVGPLLLAVAFMSMSAAACVTIAPSGDLGSPGVTAKPVADADASIDPTIGPKRTKKPRQPRATAAPTTAATSPPTDTPTEQPTAAPVDTPATTPDPNATPICCFTFHLPPFDIPSGLVLQPITPTFDYTASPNYGTASLTAGFVPDPYSVGMTAGGSVDASYLGSSCAGFATSSPDLEVNFTGASSLLRIYFVGSSGDSTIVVNDPYGNFYCVDDSFGTVNPTIDFNNPAGGTYDVWVGSYASGSFVSGTMYITENSGNHP